MGEHGNFMIGSVVWVHGDKGDLRGMVSSDPFPSPMGTLNPIVRVVLDLGVTIYVPEYSLMAHECSIHCASCGILLDHPNAREGHLCVSCALGVAYCSMGRPAYSCKLREVGKSDRGLL